MYSEVRQDMAEKGQASKYFRGTPIECMDWAFGEDWSNHEMTDWPALWNERHDDLFVVYQDDHLDTSLAKIYTTWWSQQERSATK